jgi:hypothetical protein
MATPAQIAANRLNSQKSTGPKSIDFTRFNALKLGIDAQSRVIPGEDPAELDALAESYREQFRPMLPVEVALLDSLITADWELRRLRKIQPKLWSEDAFLDPDSKEAKRLARFYRRLDTTERSYHRTLKELNKYSAARAALELEKAQEEAARQAPKQTEAQTEAAIEAAANQKLASFLNWICPPPEGLNAGLDPLLSSGAPSAPAGPIPVTRDHSELRP